MNKTRGGWVRRVVLILVAVGFGLGLWRALQPTPVLVDVAQVSRGPLRVTVDDDGRTRVRDRYVVSAPILGQLLRTPLRAGDPVVSGETLLAEFLPVVSTPLDARAREQAKARLEQSRAALLQATASRDQLHADHEFAQSELERVGHLVQDGIEPPDAYDRAERDARRAEQGLRAAEFAVQVARYEVEVAEAALWEPTVREGMDPNGSGQAVGMADGSIAIAADTGRLQLRAPVDGVVLRIFEESTRTLTAGTPIFELADTRALELEAEYLTQDAVKVRPGMAAEIVGWGGTGADGREQVLEAIVRRVEPGGFTKISALGVEEQRVRILLDPVRSPTTDQGADPWDSLGDGFRVEVRILLWAEADVLTVPIGALFRSGGGWSVFRVVNDTATQQRVEIGRMGRLRAQVLGGLSANDTVLLYPSELIREGTLVSPR